MSIEEYSMATTAESAHGQGALARVFWNAPQRRVRALWRICALLAIFVVGTLVLSLLFGQVAIGLSGGSADTPVTLFIVAGSAAALLAALLGVWLAGRFLDRRPFADFGFHFGRGWWLDLGFGLVLGALLMTTIFLAERAAGWVAIAETFWRP